MDVQFQRSKVATNADGMVIGSEADKPDPAAVAMPVVREQALQSRRCAMSIPDPMPAAQEAAAKRTRDAESGDAGPPHKRMRTSASSSAMQTEALPLPSDTGLLAMPDDVLLQIVALLDKAEPLSALRDLQRFRAGCKELRKRVAAPPLDLMQALRYQGSEKAIRAAMSDKQLDGQQLQAQVRTLCDRYGDVRVSLRNRAGLLPTFPHVRQRNLNALAGIGDSREMRSLFLDLDGAQDVTVKALCDALRQAAPARVSVTVRGMKWGNAAVTALLDRITQSDAIVSVAIDGSGGASSAGFRFMDRGGWGAKPVQSLGRMLQKNRSLELLDLSWMHPGDDAIEAIAHALAINSNLVELRLPGNEISEEGMQLLGQALGNNVGLATLKLDENRLGPRGVQGLLAGLRKNRTLTALSLSRCMASDATALELFSLFEHNDTLRKFEFRHAAIKGPVVACLARLLQAGGRLETLDLPGSPVGAEGALAIGALLASDTVLASLDLSGCSIGDEDLLLLVQGLRKNTRLRHLDLGMNHDLTGKGISALASALKAHQRIGSLNLRGLSIDSGAVQALADRLLANHPTLELLDLSGCMIGTEGRRRLVGAMQANTRLKKLVLDKRANWSEPGDSD